MGKKTKWYPDEIMFIKKNFYEVTKNELLNSINKTRSVNNQITLSQLRHECRRRGLMKMTLIHWNKKQIKFLKENYKIKGDTEIAEILNEKPYRSKKHFKRRVISRKRDLMKWFRTDEEVKAIIKRNGQLRDCGRFKKNHKKSKKFQEGTIRKIVCTTTLKHNRIKINGKFIPYARYRYQQLHGPLDPGLKIYHRDLDTLNDNDDNLYACKKKGISKEDYRVAIKLLTKRLNRLINKNRHELNRDKLKVRGKELAHITNLIHKYKKKL